MSDKLFKLNEKGSFILEDGEPLKPLGNVVHKLNEQQAIIEQLKKEYKIAIDEMVTDYKKLEKENEQLKSRIAFFEEQEDEFEKYTAQTIQNMIADYREG